MNEGNEKVPNLEMPAGREGLSWLSLGVWTYVKIVIIGLLLCYLFWDELRQIVYRWTTDASWSHGFLIPFFSLYFLQQKKREIITGSFRRDYLGLVFLLFFLALYPINLVQFKIGYGRPIIMIASLAAVVFFLGGWYLVKHAWLPVAYLIFAVPLPGRFYRQLTIPLREIASQVAASFLNLVPEMRASTQGVVIDVVYKGVPLNPPLDVAEACSGMRLLMAFLALGVAMAYLHYRPVWQRIVLLGSTVPIAVFCNIVRVTVTGFIYILWDPKYATGIWHDLLGISMLFLAFGLYGFIAWFMSNLFAEEKEVLQEDVIIRRAKQE